MFGCCGLLSHAVMPFFDFLWRLSSGEASITDSGNFSIELHVTLFSSVKGEFCSTFRKSCSEWTAISAEEWSSLSVSVITLTLSVSCLSAISFFRLRERDNLDLLVPSIVRFIASQSKDFAPAQLSARWLTRSCCITTTLHRSKIQLEHQQHLNMLHRVISISGEEKKSSEKDVLDLNACTRFPPSAILDFRRVARIIFAPQNHY